MVAAVEFLGVVAAGTAGQERRERRVRVRFGVGVRDRRVAVLGRGRHAAVFGHGRRDSRRRPAVQFDRPVVGEPRASDGHAVFGQRPRLVGDDVVDRAEALDDREVADERVALHERPRPEREGERDDRREALGDGRNGERDGDEEDDHRVGRGEEQLDRRDEQDERDDADADAAAEAVDLDFERRLALAGLPELVCDAPEFGVHRGGDDDGLGATPDHGGSGVEDASPVGQRRVGFDRVDHLVHRDALAGQRRLVGAAVGRGEDAGVGGDGVARFEDDHVARHDLGRGDRPNRPPTTDRRVRRRHLPERRERLFGAVVLHEAEQAVSEEDEQDERRVGVARVAAGQEADGQREAGGDEKQEDERPGELRDEERKRRDALLVREFVRPLLVESAGRVVVVEAVSARPKSLQRRLAFERVPRHVLASARFLGLPMRGCLLVHSSTERHERTYVHRRFLPRRSRRYDEYRSGHTFDYVCGVSACLSGWRHRARAFVRTAASAAASVTTPTAGAPSGGTGRSTRGANSVPRGPRRGTWLTTTSA